MHEPEPLQLIGRNSVRFRGRTLLYFSGCDYFRLSRNPRVRAAARAALVKHGLNVAASRMTTGNHPLYVELEERLANFFGAPDALLVGTGYMTNLIVAQALAGRFSHVLIDERAHPSLQDAASFFACPIVRFQHRKAEAVEEAVERCGRRSRIVLLTDGMFAQDGSAAPLKDYLSLLPRDAMLLIDDAHGAGVLGRTGKGTLEAAGIKPGRAIQTITLSKAFGAYGGAILGTAQLRREILGRSPLFAGHTPVPLPLAAAALESIRRLKTDKGLRRRLQANSLWLKAGLQELKFPTEALSTPGPIVCVVPTSNGAVRALGRAFLQAGIYPPITRYPGLPAKGYLRIVISSEHSRKDLEKIIEVCGSLPPGSLSR